MLLRNLIEKGIVPKALDGISDEDYLSVLKIAMKLHEKGKEINAENVFLESKDVYLLGKFVEFINKEDKEELKNNYKLYD